MKQRVQSTNQNIWILMKKLISKAIQNLILKLIISIKLCTGTNNCH